MPSTGCTPARTPERVVRTFLFSDIVNSTAIQTAYIRRHGDLQGEHKYLQEVREPHDRRVEERISASGGEVVNSEGDSYFVAFPDARHAIECAMAIQESLAGVPIAVSEVRDRLLPHRVQVRIGLHTGTATRIVRDGRQIYASHAINIAQRIREHAAPDQTLTSHATWDAAGEIEGVSRTEYPGYPLRGVHGMWTLVEVLWGGRQPQRPLKGVDADLEKKLAVAGIRIGKGALGTALLNRYYTTLPDGWGHFQFRILDDAFWDRTASANGWEDGWRPTDVVTQENAWGLCVPLPCRLDRGTTTEDCRMVQPPNSREAPSDLTEHAERLRALLPRGTWDGPIWLLSNILVKNNALKAEFYEGTYHAFLLNYAIMEIELNLALMENNFNVDAVYDRRDELLRLRKLFLPDGRHLVNYQDRSCAGGIVVTTASLNRNGTAYEIRYQERSGTVAEKQGVKEALPAGIHTPPRLPPNRHVSISDTVLLELAEEVFGKKMERRLKKARGVDEPPRWFLEAYARDLSVLNNLLASDRGTMCFTGWEIHELNGKYECGILFVIDDPEFWNKREKSSEIHAWYSASLADQDELVKALAAENWAGGGLFSLVNGLLALRKIKGVPLPNIEVRLARDARSS